MPANKSAAYGELAEELAALLAGEPDFVANAANMAALVYHGLADLNWAGFYFAEKEAIGRRHLSSLPLDEGGLGGGDAALVVSSDAVRAAASLPPRPSPIKGEGAGRRNAMALGRVGADDRELVLGPFQGKPACVRIPWGNGVCGTAAQRGTAIVVPDVDAFPGHIACDTASRSELVVPLVADGRVLGVFDLDSPRLARFDDDDRAGIERLVAIFLAHHGDWP